MDNRQEDARGQELAGRNGSEGAGEAPGEVGAFRLEAFLPYRFAVLSATVSRALSTIYRDRFGLTIPEWRVIANLGRHRSMAANRITELGAMDKAKVSRAVARLVDAELVARAPDPHDNRLVILSLTQEGERVHREIGPLALAWEEELASVLDAEERAVLDRALTKLTERAVQFRRGSDTDGD